VKHSPKRSISETIFVDVEGEPTEVGVRVEYTFTPDDPPEIDDLRILLADGRDILDLLERDELERILNRCWKHEGVERPMLDLSYAHRGLSARKPAETKPPKLTAPSLPHDKTQRQVS
jgi:hypothetical protein